MCLQSSNSRQENIGSGNGLVPSGTKPLLEPKLMKIQGNWFQNSHHFFHKNACEHDDNNIVIVISWLRLSLEIRFNQTWYTAHSWCLSTHWCAIVSWSPGDTQITHAPFHLLLISDQLWPWEFGITPLLNSLAPRRCANNFKYIILKIHYTV